MSKWKIVADSGCDYRQLANLAPNTEFISVPLTIQVGDEAFVDDAGLDIDHMMHVMETSKVQHVRVLRHISPLLKELIILLS